jgi:hypothetical protein
MKKIYRRYGPNKLNDVWVSSAVIYNDFASIKNEANDDWDLNIQLIHGWGKSAVEADKDLDSKLTREGI